MSRALHQGFPEITNLRLIIQYPWDRSSSQDELNYAFPCRSIKIDSRVTRHGRPFAADQNLSINGHFECTPSGEALFFCVECDWWPGPTKITQYARIAIFGGCPDRPIKTQMTKDGHWASEPLLIRD